MRKRLKKSIEACLLKLLDPDRLKTQSLSSNVTTVNPPDNFASPSYYSKRDFLKIIRPKDSHFAGPYEESLLRTVKQIFEQDCLAFELRESQKLSFLHVIFCAEALRYFTDEIKPKCTSVSEDFVMMHEHFITASHMNTYMTEWSTLTFKDIQMKNTLQPLPEVLGILYQRGQDLQSILPAEYHSPFLLRYFSCAQCAQNHSMNP